MNTLDGLQNVAQLVRDPQRMAHTGTASASTWLRNFSGKDGFMSFLGRDSGHQMMSGLAGARLSGGAVWRGG